MLKTVDIRAQMALDNGEYHPTPIQVGRISLNRVTRITLTDLRLRPSESTRQAAPRCLASRFSIIGPEHSIAVSVDGVEIGVTDTAPMMSARPVLRSDPRQLAARSLPRQTAVAWWLQTCRRRAQADSTGLGEGT